MERFKRPKPAGGEDVEFEDVVAEEVESDQAQAVLAKSRSDPFDGASLRGREAGRQRLPALMEVRAMLSLHRDAFDGDRISFVREGLAVEEDHPHVFGTAQARL